MSRYRRTLNLTAWVWALVNSAGEAAPLPQPKNNANVAKADFYGDPLPALATARLGTLRWHHPKGLGGGFTDASFSQDGRFVACVNGMVLTLRETASGTALPLMPRNTRVVAAQFADGNSLLTAEMIDAKLKDKSYVYATRIRLWNLESGKVSRESIIDRATSDRCTHGDFFSSDGRFFVGCNRGNRLTVWDRRSGAEVLHVERELVFFYPTMAALDPLGDRIAYVDKDHIIRIVDLVSKKEVGRIDDEKLGAESIPSLRMRFLAKGQQLLVGDAKSLRLWDVTTGKSLREAMIHVSAQAVSPDETLIAVGNRECVHLIDTATFRDKRSLEQSAGHYLSLTFAKDGMQLVSTDPNTLGIWDVPTGKKRNRALGHDLAVVGMAFSADHARLATGGSDGAAIVWSLASGKMEHVFRGHVPGAHALAFRPDGNMLAVGEGRRLKHIDGSGLHETQIRLWALNDGQLAREFTGHINSVESLAFAPDGKTLASGGSDARVRVWDPENGQRRFQIRVKAGQSSVGYSPTGNEICVISTRDPIAIYDAATGQSIRHYGDLDGKERFVGGGFVAKGTTVAAYSVPGFGAKIKNRIRFWDVASGKETAAFPVPGGSRGANAAEAPFALSFDGSLAATLRDDSAPWGSPIQLWDTASGTLLIQLSGHPGPVHALEFSANSRQLASGGQDGSTLVWDLNAVRLSAHWWRLADDERAFEAMAANPDAVPFLAERIKLAAALTANYAKTIADLTNNRDEIREKAQNELSDDPTADFALRLAEITHVNDAVRTQIAGILDRQKNARQEQIRLLYRDFSGLTAGELALRFQVIGVHVNPFVTQFIEGQPVRHHIETVVRARYEKAESATNFVVPMAPKTVLKSIELLKRIGTPAALEQLRSLANGPPDSALTREAKAVLDVEKK